MRVLVVISLLSLFAACDPSSSDDMAASLETPILARTNSAAYRCQVQTDHVEYKPVYWSYAGHDSISTDSASWVARIESAEVVDYQPTPGKLVVSTIDESGKLGESHPIESALPSRLSGLRLIAQASGGFALLFVEPIGDDGGAALRFVRLDAQGNALAAAKTLASGASAYVRSLSLARTPNGKIAVVWNAANTGVYDELRMSVIDDDGTMISAVQTLAERSVAPPEVVATSAGFAVLFKTFSGTGDKTVGELELARFDERGVRLPSPNEQLVKAAELTTSGSFAGEALSLLALEDGYLAAWQEGRYGDEDSRTGKGQGGYVFVRVARLDASGALVESAPLRAPEDSIDEVEPVLVRHGAQVALLWGRGKHIYVCGGCVPDQNIELVLIDPTTLQPVSDVAIVPAPKVGGLLHKRSSLRAGTLLTTFQTTFHTSSDPGFAAFRCTPSEG